MEVQTNVAAAGRPGKAWIKISVANGDTRVEREREFSGAADDRARKIAVANAWAIAKEIKPLPLDTGKEKIERIVDRHFTKKTSNPKPEELF